MSLMEIRRIYNIKAYKGQRVKIAGRTGVIIGSKNDCLRIKIAGKIGLFKPTQIDEYNIKEEGG